MAFEHNKENHDCEKCCWLSDDGRCYQRGCPYKPITCAFCKRYDYSYPFCKGKRVHGNDDATQCHDFER